MVRGVTEAEVTSRGEFTRVSGVVGEGGGLREFGRAGGGRGVTGTDVPQAILQEFIQDEINRFQRGEISRADFADSISKLGAQSGLGIAGQRLLIEREAQRLATRQTLPPPTTQVGLREIDESRIRQLTGRGRRVLLPGEVTQIPREIEVPGTLFEIKDKTPPTTLGGLAFRALEETGEKIVQTAEVLGAEKTAEVLKGEVPFVSKATALDIVDSIIKFGFFSRFLVTGTAAKTEAKVKAKTVKKASKKDIEKVIDASEEAFKKGVLKDKLASVSDDITREANRELRNTKINNFEEFLTQLKDRGLIKNFVLDKDTGAVAFLDDVGTLTRSSAPLPPELEIIVDATLIKAPQISRSLLSATGGGVTTIPTSPLFGTQAPPTSPLVPSALGTAITRFNPLDTKSNILTGETTSQGSVNKLKDALKSGTLQKTAQDLGLSLGQAQDILTQQLQRQPQAQTSLQSLLSGQVQQQQQRQKMLQQQGQLSNLLQKTKLKTKLKPIPLLPGAEPSPGVPVSIEGVELWSAHSKRFGKRVELGEFETSEEAINTLNDFVGGTLAASGGLSKGERKISASELVGILGNKFRPSKVDPFSVVEKKSFRLDSPREVSEILSTTRNPKKNNPSPTQQLARAILNNPNSNFNGNNNNEFDMLSSSRNNNPSSNPRRNNPRTNNNNRGSNVFSRSNNNMFGSSGGNGINMGFSSKNKKRRTKNKNWLS